MYLIIYVFKYLYFIILANLGRFKFRVFNYILLCLAFLKFMKNLGIKKYMHFF